jgi:hypothetical protein
MNDQNESDAGQRKSKRPRRLLFNQSSTRSHGADQFTALLITIEARALEMACGDLDESGIPTLACLAHVLIAARRLVNESQRVAMARDKLEIDVATECLTHKLDLDRICADESLSEADQIQAVREKLFGPDLPLAVPPFPQ